MAPNSIAPAFVKINYASEFAPHSMEIPCVPVIAAVGGGAPYTFDLRGLEIDVPVSTGVMDFINLVKIFFHSTVKFIDWTLYTLADPDAPALPVQTGSINVAGTNASDTWYKAVQRTHTWRTDAFGVYKLVLLDAISSNNFDKQTELVVDSALANLSNYVTADATWFAGRDGGRPDVFLQVSITLNEKLRRSYRMN
jgi:hypothetical protein